MSALSSFYWPYFDQTLKASSWDQQKQQQQLHNKINNNNNNNNNEKKKKKNPHLNFLKGTVIGDKE